jgi:hypothetical protein
MCVLEEIAALDFLQARLPSEVWRARGEDGQASGQTVCGRPGSGGVLAKLRYVW